MKKLVFISSPYSGGETTEKVRVQHDVWNNLFEKGFMPFAPLLYHYQDIIHPRSYEDWMEVCLFMVEKSDFVLRLPGESSGADREVKRAEELGIPVAYSMEELMSLSREL